MCILKVANQRGSDECRSFPASGGGGGGDGDDGQDESYSQEMLESQTLSHFQELNNQSSASVSASASSMLMGYSQTREMSAMVSALTRVVSGRRAADLGYAATGLGGAVTSSFGLAASASASGSGSSPSSAYSASGSAGFWIGQKRGREEEASARLLESAQQRVYRGFGDFRDSSSSSSATGSYLI